MQDTPAQASGTLTLLGGPDVVRMGYGAMRVTGPGIWGPPPDHDAALAVIRRAVELGVTFIDTADSYGPFVSEDLIREALHPYQDVVIATKGGLLRTGPDNWIPCGRPEYLRQCVEMSLRRLGVDTIQLYQLHRVDDAVPLEEQVGVLSDMRDEGKIRLVGLSQVDVATLEAAREVTMISSVQNLYNLSDRSSHNVLEHCEAQGIAFIPWYPIAGSQLAGGSGRLAEIAEAHGVSTAQVSLAWLLATSPVMLPIPGTSKLDHLEENVAASQLHLTLEQMTTLDKVADG